MLDRRLLALLGLLLPCWSHAQPTAAPQETWIATCPVSNCPSAARGALLPGGGPVLSKQWLYGQTMKDRLQDEWLSNLGLYIGTGAGQGQKVTQYLGAMQGPGAGAGWALNTDIVRGACPGGPNSLYGLPGSGIPFGAPGCATRPGSLGKSDSTIGYELDLTNWDQDGGPGGAFVVGMMVQTLSSFTSTTGILFNAYVKQQAPSWYTGIHFTGPIDGGPVTVKENTVLDNSGSNYGYHLQGEHPGAAFRDDSTGRFGMQLLGSKREADLQVVSSSPTSLAIAGQHTSQAIGDQSVAPTALNLAGTYSRAAIVTSNSPARISLSVRAGQSVCFDGVVACVLYDTDQHKWLFVNVAGKVVTSIDDQGNATFSGKVTQNGQP